MARYIVSYRISQYWGRIVAYRYRHNYPQNEIDIVHDSNYERCRQHIALNAISDIHKGSLMERQYTRRQSDTNWQ